MAVILPHSFFYRIPKTGGTWVREVLIEMNLFSGFYGIKRDDRMGLSDHHITPDQVPSIVTNNKFTFTFIREPVEWYRSYWAYKMTNGGWDKLSFIDTVCQANNFDSFVKNCIEEFPHGLVSTIYKRFFLDEMNFVGKQENLREDLKTALKLANEDFDEKIIDTFPNKNMSNKDEKREPTEETFNSIHKTEKWVYDNYYPEFS